MNVASAYDHEAIGLLRRLPHVGYQMVTPTVLLFVDTLFFN